MRSFLLVMKQSKFNTDASHLTYISKSDHRQGDWRLVFYNAFPRSTQSAEMLRNTLQHTNQMRRFVVYKLERSAVLFFYICGWKQEDVFLLTISIFCVYVRTGIVQTSGVFRSLKTKAHARQDHYDSVQHHI